MISRNGAVHSGPAINLFRRFSVAIEPMGLPQHSLNGLRRNVSPHSLVTADNCPAVLKKAAVEYHDDKVLCHLVIEDLQKEIARPCCSDTRGRDAPIKFGSNSKVPALPMFVLSVLMKEVP